MNNFLFIHIPRTAGTSILKKLEEKKVWKRKIFNNHDPLFLLELNNNISKDIFKFCVCRNPFTRSFSYYKHFLFQNFKNISFEDFLLEIKNKSFYPQTPMMVYPQSFYIKNLNGKDGVDKIYKFENIIELEKDFNIKIEHHNKSFYSKEEYYSNYSKKSIDLVLEIFDVDFKTFNYSHIFK